MLVIAAVVAILIAINALYVAAEFAAVSVSTSRIQALADQRSRLARLLLPSLRDAGALDRYIAACQIGITVSSLVLGAYGQATLAVRLSPVFTGLGGMQEVTAQSTAAVVVLIALTVLQMVLGELVPKSLALQYPTRLALWTVIPMQWSQRLMAWFIVLLNGSGTAILRLVGFEPSGHRHVHSPEELEYLIAESRRGGLLDREAHRRLRRALRLGALRVEEFLVPRIRIRALEIDAPPEAMRSAVLDSPFTRIPVYRRTIDDIIGFLHTKEVARQAAEQGAIVDIESLVRPVLAVPARMTADQLLVRMREEKRQLAIVVDEFGGTAGLVTIEDVLEQVVGEIVDEFKPPDPVPEWLPDGRVRLPGGLHVDELEPWIGGSIEKGETHTIGGRIAEKLERLPRPGDRIVLGDIALEVEAMEQHAVKSVLATLPERRLRERERQGDVERDREAGA
ncbi:MAG: hemolysin family protein [Gemmatimonadaceae bacterium]